MQLQESNLSRGNRNKAHEYHQKMHNMGAAPSSNTFGLYIVSLKDSHQTHDEASDAVQIFKMAMQEGVQPTSFLFNAVICKLSKARRVDDCLNLFIRIRLLGIKPTSVTFGTMINALIRVGDENLAVELFNEMEAQSNYKPRPAPYNSIMQFYVNTKHDRSKALEFYERMLNAKIDPTSHTYKLQDYAAIVYTARLMVLREAFITVQKDIDSVGPLEVYCKLRWYLMPDTQTPVGWMIRMLHDTKGMHRGVCHPRGARSGRL
jgi:pentatricopeptide repeat protein